MDPRDIVSDFDAYFDIVPATSAALKDIVYQIRFRVYADELGWENAAQFPTGREQDAFDAHAAHCLLKHRPSDAYIGCVRLVQTNPQDRNAPLPIEAAYARRFSPDVSPGHDAGARSGIGEISRIAVISDFRHRPGERNEPGTSIQEAGKTDPRGRRRFPHIALGLYLAAAACGVNRDLQSVLAMMEPKLARRLRIFGIRFEQVADPIEHHGLRAAYRLTHESFYANLSPPLRALFEFIQAKVAVPTAVEIDASSDETQAYG